MRNKKIIQIIIVLMILLISLVGCNGRTIENQNITDVETFENQAVPVKLENVISDEVYQSIYTIGEIKSSEKYQVNAMTNGDVIDIFFNVGDYVQEGDVLFTIEKTDFEVDKSTNITQSLNAVNQSKISYDSTKENYEKYLILLKNGVISQTELDNMKNQYDNVSISYENALKSYESVVYNYESLAEKYDITSPVSGIITNKNVAEGMFASTQNGFTIEIVDQYIVSSQVASKYINEIKEKQEVEIYISTLDKTINGTIDSISLSGTNGSYPIEIKLDGDNSELKSGMYADIWILTNKTSEGLWIPSKSLLQENGESFVYIVNDGKAKKIIVEIISMRGDNVAVKSELNKEDKVITLGKEFVMNDSLVDIKE